MLESALGEAAAAALRAALATDGPAAAALRDELLEMVGPGPAELELRERLDRELRIARRIQQQLVLVTTTRLEGWETACEYRPAREIGGDFFDVFPLPDGPDGVLDPPATPRRLGMVIADVSGKGISAAMLMAFVRPVMRTAMDRTGDPVEALERTNRILATERQTGLFVTAIAAAVDLVRGTIQLASAGHEPPIVVPSDGSSAGLIDLPAAPLLGAFERLGAAPTEIELRPGDALVLYTDGVTDTVDGRNERFGEARFLDALTGATGRSADAIRSGVLDAISAFGSGGGSPVEPADDLALLVVRRASD